MNSQYTKTDYVFGTRAVIETIRSGQDIDKILLKKDLNGESVDELLQIIKEYNIVTQRVPVERLNRITRKNHQGVIAFLSPITYYDIDNLIPSLFEAGKNPIIILLDGITDVRNFGAIARTCECAGVDAIIIPDKHSVSVNADAVKTSAGALLHIPVVRVSSLYRAIQNMKNSGFTIIGASEKGSEPYTSLDYTSPTVLVMGAEDTGISSDILKICDHFAAIPMMGRINSLNVSVAAGILIYEIVRQRNDADI